MTLNNPPLVCSSGTYVGNDSADRAIPHGLGRTPKIVIVMAPGFLTFFTINPVSAEIFIAGGGAAYAVTAPDDVDFHVGNAVSYPNSANANLQNYNWVAI